MTIERTRTRRRAYREPVAYEIGYGKPPVATRFQKGRSGNPSGRPRGSRRMSDFVMEEAYRLLTVRDGEEIKRLPAVQVILRSLVMQAVKGNGAAKRAVLEAVKAVEKDAQAHASADPLPTEPKGKPDIVMAAKGIALMLATAKQKLE